MEGGSIRLGESSGLVPGVPSSTIAWPGVTANGSNRRYRRADEAPNLSVRSGDTPELCLLAAFPERLQRCTCSSVTVSRRFTDPNEKRSDSALVNIIEVLQADTKSRRWSGNSLQL